MGPLQTVSLLICPQETCSLPPSISLLMVLSVLVSYHREGMFYIWLPAVTDHVTSLLIPAKGNILMKYRIIQLMKDCARLEKGILGLIEYKSARSWCKHLTAYVPFYHNWICMIVLFLVGRGCKGKLLYLLTLSLPMTTVVGFTFHCQRRL